MVRHLGLNRTMESDPFLRAADYVAMAVEAVACNLRPLFDGTRTAHVEQVTRRVEQLHKDLMEIAGDYRFDAACGRPWRNELDIYQEVEEATQQEAAWAGALAVGHTQPQPAA